MIIRNVWNIFDFVTIFKKAQMDEREPQVDLMEKYYKT